MAYPPTSPYGGPSFASEFDILVAIACQTQEMAVAAGGSSHPIDASSTFGLLASIDCNLCSGVDALGGTACVGGYDGVMGLLMSIACNSRALVIASGGTPAGGSYTYNPFTLWQQIACNFGATATATGTGSSGGGFDSIWNIMIAVYCAVAQIVDNGFGPPVESFLLLTNDGDNLTTNDADLLEVNH